ncbi:hypothetical protein ALC57_11249 [Trachymyrmex cornetzi]|uniref:Uncharacterized protein n=1 Tax=Trachymyrmex cornetzi TaxID=471704 RepID=A0A151J2X8_9HYME|nr:hypothetical protein ALC57_11249 [Trachymyrmex cornetzi]
MTITNIFFTERKTSGNYDEYDKMFLEVLKTLSQPNPIDSNYRNKTGREFLKVSGVKRKEIKGKNKEKERKGATFTYYLMRSELGLVKSLQGGLVVGVCVGDLGALDH